MARAKEQTTVNHETPVAGIDNLDFSNTPDSVNMPDQLYNFEIVSLELTEAGANKTHCNQCKTDRGKKGIRVTYEILEPATYKGLQLMENFWIGSDADPCAHRPETLMRPEFGGHIAFQQMRLALAVTKNSDLLRKRFQSFVVTVPDKNDSTKLYNNLKGQKYPIGTMIPGQSTPEKLYPKGVERLPTSQPTISQPSPQTMNCPRCGKEFPSDVIDNHVVECNLT